MRVNIDESGVVSIDGECLPDHLTRKEAAMLQAVLRRGSLATKEYLLMEMYAGRDEPELKIVDVFACKIRKKLGVHASMLLTMWGRGYMRGEGYEPVDPPEVLRISSELRRRLDELVMASNCAADMLGAKRLSDAVRHEEERVWA